MPGPQVLLETALVCEIKGAGSHCSEGEGRKSRHHTKPRDSIRSPWKCTLHRGHGTSTQPNEPPLSALEPRPQETPCRQRWGAGGGGFPWLEHSWDPPDLLVNMQTQIDLFPSGTRYYSQILINLQMPPVPPVSSPGQRILVPRRLGPRDGHRQKEGCPGPRGAPVCEQEEPRDSESWKPEAVPLLISGRLTEPFVTSRTVHRAALQQRRRPRRRKRARYTWEGKTNMFPTLTQPTAE